MPDVVVGDSFDIAKSHGQDRLGAIQRLNLGLLIDGQDHGVVGWVEVEADHIAQFRNGTSQRGKNDRQRNLGKGPLPNLGCSLSRIFLREVGND